MAKLLKTIWTCIFFLLLTGYSYSQSNISKTFSDASTKDIFGSYACLIRNVGQYGDFIPGHEKLGRIIFGYEGFVTPVWITTKAIVFIRPENKRYSYKEVEEKKDRVKSKPEYIVLEWLNGNSTPEFQATGKLPAYHTYGLLKAKASSYKQVTLKNIYPGIDVIYDFPANSERGFAFNLKLQPGADPGVAKMRFSGDIQSLKKNSEGGIDLAFKNGGIRVAAPLSFYANESGKNNLLVSGYTFQGNNIIGFRLESGYDKTQPVIIDPFVSGTGSLTGPNTGMAKDIDFDYAGNVYVAGGDGNAQKLAKYDPNGTLLWTFSGQVTSQNWFFGNAFGGWVVEKMSGNIYLGQGLSGAGFRIIRLNPSGVYDSYITTANANFLEAWKLIWTCNGGTANLMIAGGGGNANNELAILSPPGVNPTANNLSGLTGGHNDISDVVVDPVTFQMYTIYSTPVNNASQDNIIYKHAPPYNFSTLLWQKPTSYFNLREPNNRPYTANLDNSSNVLAVNSSYLFYWDGVNLKAIDKATGNNTGLPFVFPTALLQQGGIFADECNNIFIGFTNGTIKVLSFDGNAFSDGPADISIPGFSTQVYDLAYDEGKKMMYACGNGFVTAIDVSAFCPSTVYSLELNPDCATLSVTVTLSPIPPPGTTVTYSIYDGATLIASNTTGIFTGLTFGINYTVKVFLNQACSGTQVADNFTFTNNQAILSITDPNAVCIPEGTTDITLPMITAGSDPGLTYTYWLDAAATIPVPNPTAVPAGTYYIKGSPLLGCYAVKPVAVPALPVPVADAGEDKLICFGQSTQLNASGGITYSWTPATYLDNPNIPNPRVINPSPGQFAYHLTITDINGCHSLPEPAIVNVLVPEKLRVIPNDTIIAFNQPLQLVAMGPTPGSFINYTWSPSHGLNDPNIANPVATIDRDMTYVIKATNAAGCEAFSGVHVKVYKGPEIYVPTAFTPGTDGRNDLLRVIPVGIKDFRYFRVYNRWGQLVFSTSDYRKGWDGSIVGRPQASGVFVWVALGIDYLGNPVSRKGTVTLIR